MARRLALQTILENLMQAELPAVFPDTKSNSRYHVYFQPGSNVTLVYPAIVYERDRISTKKANDELYLFEKRYKITVMDRNPDSTIPEAVLRLRKTSFLGHNKADGLNHDIFATYF